ncbi:MAG TPA: hypothetical protein VF912_18255 [Anaeromyxobacter sp.]
MNTRALLLALPLLALAACRDNRASIQMQAICLPPKTCLFTGKCEAQYIGFVSIDAAVSERLWIFMQVENQLPDNTNVETGKLNTNDAHADEVSVEYDGIALPRAVYELPNYSMPAGTTSVISIDVIPTALNAGLRLAAYAPTPSPRDMVANVTLRGYYDDGSRFETGAFAVGVRVCSGCLSAAPCAANTCPPSTAGILPLTCMDPAGAGTT